MEWKIRGVMPTLDVVKLPEAIQFYSRLGFTEMWRWPNASGENVTSSGVENESELRTESETLEITHAGMKFGNDVSLMLVEFKPEWGQLQRQNLYFFVENVDALYNQVQQFHQGKIEGVENHDYGMRDFSINDPWGHELTFGQDVT